MPEQPMEIQQDSLKEVLSELFTLLEAQETNSVAVLQLLKDEGVASDEKLATYLDQAGRASNVKWRAARMRMEYLLTPVQKQNSDNEKARVAPKDTEADRDDDKNKKQQQVEAKSAEAKSSEDKSFAAKSAEGKSSEAKATEAKPTEAKPSESKAPDNHDSENTSQTSSANNENAPKTEKKAADGKTA